MADRGAVAAAARGVAQSGLLLAVVLGVYWLLPVQDRPDGAWILRMVLSIVLVVAVIWWQVAAIRRSRRPLQRAIQGMTVSVAVFLVVFAAFYLTIQRIDPSAFGQPLDKVSAMYFTITTLVTVGYGDISPSGHLAQVVVSIQMVLDLVVLGVVVRLLFRTASGTVERRTASTGQDRR